MKKISIFIIAGFSILLSVSCSNEVVDIKQAPLEIKDALAKSFEFAHQLTKAQVDAGKDSVINEEEIVIICNQFKNLAIQNNINKNQYGKDKYYNAILKQQRDSLNSLSKKTVFLAKCKGYEELGLAIQKAALEVKDVMVLPNLDPEVKENLKDSLLN
jgi:hypothetical protein